MERAVPCFETITPLAEIEPFLIRHAAFYFAGTYPPGAGFVLL
jgi:hypothetical protein